MRGDKAAEFRLWEIDLRRLLSLIADAPFARTAACWGSSPLFSSWRKMPSSPAWAAQEREHQCRRKGRVGSVQYARTYEFASYSRPFRTEDCEDIPSIGRAIIVLDYEQAELRDMLVEVRVVRRFGREAEEPADINSVTVAYREPKLYPNGTINFEHNFNDPGYFVGIS